MTKNMNLFYFLESDLAKIRRWFATETASKFIVLSGFLLLFFSIAFFLYKFSLLFFNDLFSYGPYGIATVHYIFHASFILLLWFAAGSSLAATGAFLISSNPDRDFLLTSPISSGLITTWYFIRTTLMNMILLAFILVPVALSFTQVFASGAKWIYAFRFAVVLFSLVFISGAVGSLGAYFLAAKIKGKESFIGVLWIVLFLLISYILAQLIFPQTLHLLYESSPSQFESVYNSLPLVSMPLPTRLFADVFVNGSISSSLLLILLSIFGAAGTVYFESSVVETLLRVIRGKSNISGFLGNGENSHIGFMSSKYPLVLKDWYSVIRVPSESGYAVFLFAVMAFFFILLNRATSAGFINRRFTVDLILFTFAWLIFFSSTYFLRLVFPLMAREGDARWFLFTAPVSLRKILHSKLAFGIILSLPLILISAVLWLTFPYAQGNVILLSVFSSLCIFILLKVQVLLGSILPNFSEGNDPEKVSTSMMGIVTLFVSIAAAFAMVYLLSGILKGNIVVYTKFLFLLVAVVILFISFLYVLSLRLLSRS